MPNENENGGAATVAPTSAPVVDTAAQTVQQSQGSDEPLRNYREVVELRKEVRELAKLTKEALAGRQATTEQSKPATTEAKPDGKNTSADVVLGEFAALRRELALKDAYADLGIKPGPVRELMEHAVKSANPENVREFIEKYAAALQPAAPKETQATTTTAQAPAATQPARSNTGAPGVDGKIALPEDPRLIDPDVWRGMTPAERMEKFRASQRRAGANANPFPQRRPK
jgi:hypothetical protein